MQNESKNRIAQLIESLEDGSEYIRLDAVETLVGIGETAVPALIKALGNEDKYVRNRAAWALAKIVRPVETIVPALTNALSDTDWYVRSTSAFGLGAIGEPARAAVSALIRALSDADGFVRRNAAEALEKIATPEAQKALENCDQ